MKHRRKPERALCMACGRKVALNLRGALRWHVGQDRRPCRGHWVVIRP